MCGKLIALCTFCRWGKTGHLLRHFVNLTIVGFPNCKITGSGGWRYSGTLAVSTQTSAKACAEACNSNAECMYWSWMGDQSCRLIAASAYDLYANQESGNVNTRGTRCEIFFSQVWWSISILQSVFLGIALDQFVVTIHQR